MLAICEDCAKKYNIDESRIKGDKARFSCYECGHIIVVKKPKAKKISQEPLPETPESKQMSDEEAMAYLASLDSSDGQQDAGSLSPEKKKGSGNYMPALLLIAIVLAACGFAAYMYLQ